MDTVHDTVWSWYPVVNFSKAYIMGTPWLAREGEIWGVYFEFNIWHTFSLCHCRSLCSITALNHDTSSAESTVFWYANLSQLFLHKTITSFFPARSFVNHVWLEENIDPHSVVYTAKIKQYNPNMGIESDKTTSIYNVSTRVLSKK